MSPGVDALRPAADTAGRPADLGAARAVSNPHPLAQAAILATHLAQQPKANPGAGDNSGQVVASLRP